MGNQAAALKRVLVCCTLGHAGALLQAGAIDGKHAVADPDGVTEWYDGRLLVVEGKGWTNTASFYDRLPESAKRTVADSVWDLSHDAAGICLRFVSDAPHIQVRWTLRRSRLAMNHMPATGVSGIDLYYRGENGAWTFQNVGRPEGVENTVQLPLVAGREHLLYLPLYNGVNSLEIGLPRGKTMARPSPSARDHYKPIIFYGTSITQGACASRPGMARPAIVSRQLDVPVINLGFSGSGKMEMEMADLLAELDPSIYVLDCLANMGPDLVTERVAPFVRALRKARPDTPILLVEDTSYRNQTPTPKGRILRTVYEQLTQEGIAHLHFLASEGMLGTDSEGTVDGTHPNDLGMMRQAEVFIEALTPLCPPSGP